MKRVQRGTNADIAGRGKIDRQRLLRALAGTAGGLAVGALVGLAGLGIVVSLVLLWLVATASAAVYILRAGGR